MPVTIESPTPVAPSRAPDTARVAVVRTRPETVIEDYGRVMALAGYQRTLARVKPTSWTGMCITATPGSAYARSISDSVSDGEP